MRFLGLVMHFTGQLSPEKFWARIGEMDDRVRAAFAEMCFPCLGLAGWPGGGNLGRWEWQNGELTSVGLVYGSDEGGEPGVHVRTTLSDPHRLAQAGHISGRPAPRSRQDFERRLHEPEPTDGFSASIRMDSGELEVTVRPIPQGWLAVAALDGYGLVVQGHGVPVEEVALTHVGDIEPFIDGRREEIARRPGES